MYRNRAKKNKTVVVVVSLNDFDSLLCIFSSWLDFSPSRPHSVKSKSKSLCATHIIYDIWAGGSRRLTALISDESITWLLKPVSIMFIAIYLTLLLKATTTVFNIYNLPPSTDEDDSDSSTAIIHRVAKARTKSKNSIEMPRLTHI